MSKYSRQEMIAGWNQDRLRRAKVLVVGAGTTGNEVVKNVALLGIGEVCVVDNDTVEEVNLSRCALLRADDIGKPKAEMVAKRASALNPDVILTAVNANAIYDIGSLWYGGFDCIILTVDNLETRMWVNRYCVLNRKPLIDTGVSGLIGNVFVALPLEGPCLECSWTPREYWRLTERYSCSKRGLIQEETKIPMVVTSAAVVGGIATQEMLRIIAGSALASPSRAGIFYRYDGETGSFLTWRVFRNDDCPAHEPRAKDSNAVFEAGLDESVESVRGRIKAVTSASVVEISCDRDIVYAASCTQCATTISITPCPLVGFRRTLCPNCCWLSMDISDISAKLRDGYSLRALSVPPNHLLRVLFKRYDRVEEAWLATR